MCFSNTVQYGAMHFSHPAYADHASLHTPASIAMHLTAAYVMLQAEAWLAHLTAHT